LYEIPSAQKVRALGSAQVTVGYFGDLAAMVDIRLTAISAWAEDQCRQHICFAVVVVVGM
jgi:hypothetical protein